MSHLGASRTRLALPVKAQEERPRQAVLEEGLRLTCRARKLNLKLFRSIYRTFKIT